MQGVRSITNIDEGIFGVWGGAFDLVVGRFSTILLCMPRKEPERRYHGGQQFTGIAIEIENVIVSSILALEVFGAQAFVREYDISQNE